MRKYRNMIRLGCVAGALAASWSMFAPSAHAANILSQLGSINNGSRSGGSYANLPPLWDGNSGNDAFFHNKLIITADRLYQLSDYRYVENTDRSTTSIAIHSGGTLNGVGVVTANTSFTSTSLHNEVVTGTLTGLGGMFYVNLLIAANGTGAELAINGTPTVALRLANPTVLATSSNAYGTASPFLGSFNALYALDRNSNPALPVTQYASAGQGTSTHLDFDFGAPTNIGYFEIVHRTGDLATSFTLTFADDAAFTTGIQTVSVTGVTGAVSLVDVGNLTKRYVRYKVDGSPSVNPGATEIAFYTPIPEPASLALLALGGLMIATRRRK